VALTGCRRDAPVAAGIADPDSPADLVVLLSELLPAVERLSGLDRTDVIRMRRQSREAVRRYVESRLDAELPPARLDAMRRTYTMLGLLPAALDLRALLLDLYMEQVIGYYDPGTATIYVLDGTGADELRPLLAHELVHALQDQHTDIDSLVAYERGNDRQTAAHAALEGHAMVVMFAVLAEAATGRQLDPVSLPDPSLELGAALEAQNRQFPVFAAAPAIIRETLLFPYIHGSSFVHRLWRGMAPRERYPAPLGELLPQATADVLYPDRFMAGPLVPVELAFARPPAGWHVVHENNLGLLETRILLAAHGGSELRDEADGWTGDRYVLLAADDGTQLLHWVSTWRDAAAAARFAAAAGTALAVLDHAVADVASETVAGHPAVRVILRQAGVAAAAVPAMPVRLR
jgi:hypothetical protein